MSSKPSNHRPQFPCPVTGGVDWRLLVSQKQLEKERRIRQLFLKKRLRPSLYEREIKHQEEFTIPAQGGIYESRDSGILARGGLLESAADLFSNEQYHPDTLDALHSRFTKAFERRLRAYRELLPSQASVAEIGSYTGGFLAACAALNWNAYGVDISPLLTDFAKSKGLTSFCSAGETFDYGENVLDAVFIWNCFEQITDPNPLLAKLSKALKRGGFLVIRTPNALLYRFCQEVFRTISRFKQDIDSEHHLIQALAYSHLLTFPYHIGYTPATITALLTNAGFIVRRLKPISITTLPRREIDSQWRHEQFAFVHTLSQVGKTFSRNNFDSTMSPWLEITATI
jgi:SAM-dependent methyltransferase